MMPSLQKGEIWTQTRIGRALSEDGGRDGVIFLEAKEPPDAGGEARAGPPSWPQKEPTCGHLALGLPASRL